MAPPPTAIDVGVGLGSVPVDVPGDAPPSNGGRIELEDGSGFVLLEDGSGFLVLE